MRVVRFYQRCLRSRSRALPPCAIGGEQSKILRLLLPPVIGSKSNIAMYAWLPQASYPCGSFSDCSHNHFRLIAFSSRMQGARPPTHQTHPSTTINDSQMRRSLNFWPSRSESPTFLGHKLFQTFLCTFGNENDWWQWNPEQQPYSEKTELDTRYSGSSRRQRRIWPKNLHVRFHQVSPELSNVQE